MGALHNPAETGESAEHGNRSDRQRAAPPGEQGKTEKGKQNRRMAGHE